VSYISQAKILYGTAYTKPHEQAAILQVT
ncbi:MAG: hypothetical protein JWQ14_954, partial [Adhaeribacter sp.]|nr:hypothetical protein [Adhaeribacter sp.]